MVSASFICVMLIIISHKCLSLFLFIELCKEGIENGWRKFGFHETWTTGIDDVNENIIRIDGNDYSAEEFIKKFESTYTPCVISNLLTTWPANECWTLKVCLFSSIL